MSEVVHIDYSYIMCMSNINASHWKYLKKKNWDLWNLFDDFILSHELHLTKPDHAIYKKAIQMAKSKPKEIIFIDDGINNVKAAKDLGIIGIRFYNVKKLKEDLVNYGIKLD